VRQVLNADFAARAQHQGVFDGIAQFTDISRPEVGRKPGHRFGGHAGNFLAAFEIVLGDEMLDDDGDVLRALPERRDRKRKDADPKVEVFAKRPAAISSSRFLFVAVITRTSTLMASGPRPARFPFLPGP